MSEIFEALRKAQRNADLGKEDLEPAEPFVAEEPAELPPASVQPVTPVREPSHNGWLRRLWKSSHRNGFDHGESRETVVVHQGTVVGEQFRLLRTRVETAGPGTLMVTSALDNDGKTLCATSLARALAMSLDSQVVLIDADLRHPSAAQRFDIATRPGLVDYLRGEASWEECLRTAEVGRLRVLPAGASSPIATELLASERLVTLIAEMKAQLPNQYIVFDAPPLLLTADPLVLARHMDRVLLVVRAGVTPRGAVMKAIDTLSPERLFGIVFNGATQNASHYYSHGYYPQRSTYGADSDV